MGEFRIEQVNTLHKEAATFRAADSPSHNDKRSEIMKGPTKLSSAHTGHSRQPTELSVLKNPHTKEDSHLEDEGKGTAEISSSQVKQLVSAISRVSAILQREITQTKMLRTQVPNLIDKKDEFNVFENPQLNQLLPHQHMITDENKLHYLQNLMRDQDIDFWQTLRISSDFTLTDVLNQSEKKNFSRKLPRDLQVRLEPKHKRRQ